MLSSTLAPHLACQGRIFSPAWPQLGARIASASMQLHLWAFNREARGFLPTLTGQVWPCVQLGRTPAGARLHELRGLLPQCAGPFVADPRPSFGTSAPLARTVVTKACTQCDTWQAGWEMTLKPS